jgi:glycosyltransferase involved in cell wall biosynthesis
LKLLVACSSLDLRAPLSATPAWWQLLKGLATQGVELAVTAYHGPVPESPWWRAYPNPARVEGALYAAARQGVRRLRRSRSIAEGRGDQPETSAQAAIRRLAHAILAPRWKRHLGRMWRAEGGADAALLIAVPPNHLRGVAAEVRRRFGIPVLFYDGDVPASLPRHGGFATGFRIYDGATIGEFDAVLSNSQGGAADLHALGARVTYTLHYAADPDVYAPLPVPQDIDVLFYGHSAEYRGRWLQAMVEEPAAALPHVRFAVRGRALGDLGRVARLPAASFSRLRRDIARSRITLVITRSAHAGVHASSTMRPFEVAMMAGCMVANPARGLEEWFEPGKELVVVQSTEEAIDRYRFLLAHEGERRAIGAAARRRALSEHTYGHRAAQLASFIREVS